MASQLPRLPIRCAASTALLLGLAFTSAKSQPFSSTTAIPIPAPLSANRGLGADATRNSTLTVNEAPHITSAGNVTFQVGVPGSFTVTCTGIPTPTLILSGSLPGGISFTPATGLLGGTANVGTGGTYLLTLFAVNGAGSNAAQPFTLRINTAPVAGPDALGTFQDTPVNVTTAILRANDTDADADPTTILSVTGANAGTVALNSNVVIYTPKAGHLGTDAFTYQLSDGRGGHATGTVSVTIAPREIFRVTAVPLSPGHVLLTGRGAPNGSYIVQSAPNLSTGFTTLSGTLRADATGLFSYTDHSAPPFLNYYRAVMAP